MVESADTPSPAPESGVVPAREDATATPAHPDVKWIRRFYIAAFWVSVVLWVLAANPASFIFGGLPFWAVWRMRRRLERSRVGRCGMLAFAGGGVVAYTTAVWEIRFYGGCNFCSSQIGYLVQILLFLFLALVAAVSGRRQREVAAVAAPDKNGCTPRNDSASA